MKIPNELPHFDKNPTCLAVITKFTAKFYFVHEGVLKQVSSIKQKEPDKFDEEVVLVPKGEGKTHGAVSFYESKEEELARKFSKKAADKLKELVEKYGVKNVFIFEPVRLNYRLWNSLTARIQNKVRHRIRGAYADMHPLGLIEKLSISCNKKDKVLV